MDGTMSKLQYGHRVRDGANGNTATRKSLEKNMLLEQIQTMSVTMLKSVTTAMSHRRPETGCFAMELAGGCLAFSGSDVPLTRAVGLGTFGTLTETDFAAVEDIYRSRNSPVRVVISERTHPRMPAMLKTRGYESGDFLQNWWRQIDQAPVVFASDDIDVVPATPIQADLWVKTVAAGFLERDSVVDDSQLSPGILDTFHCLGFADGAQAFLAKHKGSIVGGGVLHVNGQTASIRTTSCRITHRNLGVQTALLAFRINAAREAGCRLAFSSTDQPGPSSRNLARFGFTPFSTSFTMSSPN
jgi:hypothetical protein